MGRETLVKSKIEDSMEFIKALDRTDLHPTKVLWYFYDDIDDWRLIVAGPKIDEFLPNKEHHAYKQMASIHSSLRPQAFPLSEIKLMRTDDPLMGVVSVLAGTDENSFVQMRMQNTTFNRIFISDVLVIRSA